MTQPTKTIWIVAGPSACGKTTLAQRLTERLAADFIEGDDVHPEENREKMRNKIDLTDDDRWGWLGKIRTESLGTLAGAPSKFIANPKSPAPDNVVVTCSALKKVYREVLTGRNELHPTGEVNNADNIDLSEVQVRFLVLHVPKAVAEARAIKRAARTKHYMPPELINSQFRTFEPPVSSEKDCIVIDITADDTSLDTFTKAWDKVQAVLAQNKA